MKENPLDVIHPSWDIIRTFLVMPIVRDLNYILPEVTYEPNRMDVFKVFSMPVTNVKVVILGQDPYYTANTANGYAFLSKNPNYTPPSLEVVEEMNQGPINPKSWIEQGVFLLNTALTVERNKPNSHSTYWAPFTEQVIKYLSSQNQRIIWLLWGKAAQLHMKFIHKAINMNRYNLDQYHQVPAYSDGNYVFTAAHPVSEKYAASNGRPSTGFIDCGHFHKANVLLEALSMSRIFW